MGGRVVLIPVTENTHPPHYQQYQKQHAGLIQTNHAISKGNQPGNCPQSLRSAPFRKKHDCRPAWRRLKIKLTAPPVDGAANKMCIQYLARLQSPPIDH